MKGYDQYDISRSSFEDFVIFIFDHDVVTSQEKKQGKAEPWYWRAEVTLDTRSVLGFYRRLFEAPEFLVMRYSKEQLEQGCWAMMGQPDFGVGEIIWEKKVPFEERAACVRSMYYLYERLFSREPLETSSYMWWDALAYDWHCENRSRSNGGEDETMQDVMFETLERILDLPSEVCQTAALHGLGHLHHPNTQEACCLGSFDNRLSDPDVALTDTGNERSHWSSALEPDARGMKDQGSHPLIATFSPLPS